METRETKALVILRVLGGSWFVGCTVKLTHYQTLPSREKK